MTTKPDAVTKLIRKAIDGINSLPVSAPPDQTSMRILMQVHEDLEAAIRILDLVQCDLKAQADKL